MKDCHDLHNKIEELIHRGYLGCYIQRPRDPSPRWQGPVEKQIDVIIRGSASRGDNTSGRKAYVRPRVMVDTGSSIDILYKDAFQKLELTTTNLSLISSTRMGRCGETPPRNQRAPDLLRGRRALPSLGSQGTPLPLLGRPSCLSPLARSSIQDSNNDLHGGGAPDCVQHPWAADPQQPKSSCLHLPQHHKVSHWSGSWGNQEQPMGVEVLLPNRGYIAEETESRTSNPRRNYCATLVLGPTASKPSRGSRVAS
ncbi:hypothetical protein BHE74_00008502 [Ensete ventricosum]|nr:hypothetical protein BHE74_00008502 [Ensete ventricosum]